MGIIGRPRFPWSFLIIMIKFRDGTYRLCVDYITLDKVIKLTSYLLPIIDDMLLLIDKCTHSTTMDLKSGYWHVYLDPDSKEKTEFTCHKELFSFNVMPFGINSAPEYSNNS